MYTDTYTYTQFIQCLRVCLCVCCGHTYAQYIHSVYSACRFDFAYQDYTYIIDLFCKRALEKRLYSAKETYDLIDSTDCSHPIPRLYIHHRSLVQKGPRKETILQKRPII